MLSSKSVEWVLEISQDPMNKKWHQQVLIVGDDLKPFDEFVVERLSLKERPGMYSRIYSDNDHDCPHIDLELRRRGAEETETMTVAVPMSLVPELIELLNTAAAKPSSHRSFRD
jgi:hypothetical protein